MSRRLKIKSPDDVFAAGKRASGCEQPDTVPSATGESPGRGVTVVVCLLLALAVWLVFGQTLGHEFVNYDNNVYVYENPNITAGLSLKGILWAFTHVHVDEWWPLNSISHMVDCQLYGLYAGGHHLTNVLLHGATVVLLFLVLRNMTGTFWRSALVAALFAIHPLRVESVAWVTERKDVLSGLFFVLTLGAYARYARRPFAWNHYLLVLLCFTLGLLSKSMLVTMPFLLVLLDWWPLRRIGLGVSPPAGVADNLRRVVLEKIPLLLLAAGGCVTTILAVDEIHPTDELSLSWRAANALVAYGVYLWQMVYPVGLAPFYPHLEQSLEFRLAAVSAVALLAITAAVVAGWRKRPQLLIGWCWYLGMLVPVIGLVQVGAQAHADRYTYLPQIGIYLMVAWLAAEWVRARKGMRLAVGIASALVLVALGVRAYDQTKHWRDSVSLWEHALAVTTDNYLAHHNLGASLAERGRLDEAMPQYHRAIQLKPGFAEAHYGLAVALGHQGKTAEAIDSYRRAIQIRPDYAQARNNLGAALVASGQIVEGIEQYEWALQADPIFPEAHYNLGVALARLKRWDEAIHQYQRAIEMKTDYPEARYNLANRLAAQGRHDEAIEHLLHAIRVKPDFAEAFNNLGNRLATQKRWEEAAKHFERALELKPDYAEAHNNFGVMLAGQGKLDEAIWHYKRAGESRSNYAEARANMGNALAAQGKTDAALEHLHEALRMATAQTNTGLAQALLARLQGFQIPPPATEPLEE